MNMNNIKAILFDSGRTLNAPRTGYWFITPNFFNIINSNNYWRSILPLKNIKKNR